jgi:hypothetical protein
MRQIRIAILVIAIALVGSANAVADLLTTDVGPGSTGSSGPSTPSFLLIQTGSIMLIQTGSKLEIHS